MFWRSYDSQPLNTWMNYWKEHRGTGPRRDGAPRASLSNVAERETKPLQRDRKLPLRNKRHEQRGKKRWRNRQKVRKWPEWVLVGWSDLWAARASIQFIIFIYLCIYFGPMFSHGTGVGITCMLLPLSLGPLHWQLCFFSLQTQPDVTRPCTPHTISGVCSLAPAPEVQGCLQNGK